MQIVHEQGVFQDHWSDQLNYKFIICVSLNAYIKLMQYQECRSKQNTCVWGMKEGALLDTIPGKSCSPRH